MLTAKMIGMTDPMPTRRFRPTPAWSIYGLLVVEGLLWLSERYRLFWFNEKKGWTVLITVAAVGMTMLFMLLWFVVSLVFRWRFQFSIRSLLVLTVAVALPSSWLAVEVRQMRLEVKRQEDLAAAIENSGGGVLWSDPSAAVRLRRVFGDGYDRSIVHAIFPPNVDVTDEVLSHLEGLDGLTQVTAWDTQHVTEAGLQHLKGLSHLRILAICSTEVTDNGLENLRGLNNLEMLGLRCPKITDAGLESLKGLSKLTSLDLLDTQVTDAGEKNLKQALPNCYIIH
jgi:hypothetical protein